MQQCDDEVAGSRELIPGGDLAQIYGDVPKRSAGDVMLEALELWAGLAPWCSRVDEGIEKHFAPGDCGIDGEASMPRPQAGSHY